MMPRVASLCSGFEGIGLGLTLAGFDHDLAFVSDVDPAASKLLAHRFPSAPNLGDITMMGGGPYGLPRCRLTAPRRARQAAKRHARRVAGWRAAVTSVDVLTGGVPCQPFSSAGLRLGTRDGRHLWPTGMLPAVEALRPSLVVLENVPGLMTIQKGAVFAQVLADLDDLGYTVSWTTVGACRVGACHHRHRVFLAATLVEVAAPSCDPVALRAGDGWAPLQDVLFGDAAAVKWPASGMTKAGRVWALPTEPCGPAMPMLNTPTVEDGGRYGSQEWADRWAAGETIPETQQRLRTQVLMFPPPAALPPTPSAVQPARFGAYEAAVRRQELAFGPPAPEPVQLGRGSVYRLAAGFPEWMMGLPPGHLTGVLVCRGCTGRARCPACRDVIRLAGNGVVPAQCAYALSALPTFRASMAALSPEAVAA